MRSKETRKLSFSHPKRAMVLAAGLGTRLRPITNNTPKPLVKIANRSLLDHAIDQLVASEVEVIVVNTHYLSRQIEQHLVGRDDAEIITSSHNR